MCRPWHIPRDTGVAGRAVLSRTFTGVWSAARTLSAASAAVIASSKPASLSRADTRAAALSTQPAETGTPGSMLMTSAARSGGTFPVSGQQYRGGVQHRPVGH
jgi:hypothetical protein